MKAILVSESINFTRGGSDNDIKRKLLGLSFNEIVEWVKENYDNVEVKENVINFESETFAQISEGDDWYDVKKELWEESVYNEDEDNEDDLDDYEEEYDDYYTASIELYFNPTDKSISCAVEWLWPNKMMPDDSIIGAETSKPIKTLENLEKAIEEIVNTSEAGDTNWWE